MEVLPLKLRTEELSPSISVPFIALIENQHYIVVYKFNESWVWISDPAVGRYKISRKQFESSWLHQGQGFALVLKPKEDWNPSVGDTHQTDSFASKVWKPRHAAPYYFAVLLEMVSVYFILQLLGYILEHTPLSLLTASSVFTFTAFVLLVAAWMFLNGWWSHILQLRAQNISMELRRFSQTDIHHFDNVEMAHDLLDQARIEERIASRLGYHRKLLLALFLVFWISFQFPYAGLVSVILLCAILPMVFMNRLNFIGAYYWGNLDKDKQLIINTLPSLFNASPNEKHRFETDSRQLAPRSLYPYSLLIISGVCWFLLLLLLWQMCALSFPLLFTLSLAGLGFLYTTGGVLKAIRAGFLKQLDQIANAPDSETSIFKGDLRLSELSYIGAEEDMERSVTITPGKATLILGPPKSGKSLLMQRLMGRNIEDGGIWLFDGKPITIPQRSVIQSKILFVGHLVHAIHHQDVLDMEKPQGPQWDALCSRLGLKDLKIKNEKEEKLPDQVLEYQQKLIAITIYRDPEMLLLDEPLKGMNPFNAQIFMENVLAIRKGKTTVISSQFEEMVPLCDAVINLDKKVEE
jgi:ATP-binding cassette subfamily B protein